MGYPRTAMLARRRRRVTGYGARLGLIRLTRRKAWKRLKEGTRFFVIRRLRTLLPRRQWEKWPTKGNARKGI